jgi:hypothetical protein
MCVARSRTLAFADPSTGLVEPAVSAQVGPTAGGASTRGWSTTCGAVYGASTAMVMRDTQVS